MPKFRGPTVADLTNLRPNLKRQTEELPPDVLPIIGLDPGGILGFSLLVLPRWLPAAYSDVPVTDPDAKADVLQCDWDAVLARKKLWDHGELATAHNEDLAMYRIGKLFEAWPSAAVVCESFKLRPGKRELSNDPLSPVRQAATLQHYLYRSRRRIHYQDPSFKATMHDERLRYFGVYVKEKGMQGHAIDADRHVLMFLRRCMSNKDLAAEAWPHIYGGEYEASNAG